MSPRRVLLIGALLAALLPAIAAAPASGGTYLVWTCKTPGNAPTSTAGWTTSVMGATREGQWVVNDCSTGGGLQVRMNGAGAWAGSGWLMWTWTAPAATRLVGAALRYTLRNTPNGSDLGSSPGWWVFKDAPAYDGNHVLATCHAAYGCGGGDDTFQWSGDAAAIGVASGCGGDPAGYCVGGDRMASDIRWGLMKLRDDTAPSIGAVSGSALDARPLTGKESLAWGATDTGGGVYQSEVKIGDTVVVPRGIVDRNDGRCGLVWGGEFPHPVPCKLAASQNLSIDTTKVPNGTHELVATAWDAAGNPATITTRKVVIDNPPVAAPLPPLVPDNGSGGDPASGKLVPGRKRTKARAGFKRPVALAGRLVDGAGKPLAGAQLDVYETPAGGARTKVAELKSGTKGAYRYTARPRSNRLVEVVYSQQRGDLRYQSAHAVNVSVRAGITITLTPKRIPARGRATIRGRVLVEGLPSDGVVVQIRAKDRGRWLSAGVARTDAQGRFTWSHRYRISRGSIALYAYVLKDPALPALPGASRTVRVQIG